MAKSKEPTEPQRRVNLRMHSSSESPPKANGKEQRANRGTTTASEFTDALFIRKSAKGKWQRAKGQPSNNGEEIFVFSNPEGIKCL